MMTLVGRLRYLADVAKRDDMRGALRAGANEVEHLRAEIEALTEARAAAWEQCDTYKAQIGHLHDENEALREALRNAAEEPNIDKARAIADAVLAAGGRNG